MSLPVKVQITSFFPSCTDRSQVANWPLSRPLASQTSSPWYHFMILLNTHFLKVQPLTSIDLYMQLSLLLMATRTMWFPVAIFRPSEGERELDRPFTCSEDVEELCDCMCECECGGCVCESVGVGGGSVSYQPMPYQIFTKGYNHENLQFNLACTSLRAAAHHVVTVV